MNTLIDIPTHASFGVGVRDNIHDIISNSNQSATILIVTTNASLSRKFVADIISTLEKNTNVVIWDEVKPNPRTSDIDNCFKKFQDFEISHIIGIGGGSVLDQAKATAMALHTGEPIIELLKNSGGLPPRDNILILLPTTSGTGAELSFGSILTNDTTNEKVGLRGRTLAADFALVDPELTYSAPTRLSMVTGFDILTHALETYFSTRATPFTEGLSQAAVERVFKWLPILKADIDNDEARSELSYASMIMGINLALSTTCLPHRLQYPIGAATDTAHAEGLAAIYAAWLNQLRPKAQAKMAKCAEWIGIADQAHTQFQNAEAFEAAVLQLLSDIELNLTLDDLNINPEMVDELVSQVSGLLTTDPSFTDENDIKSIYVNSF